MEFVTGTPKKSMSKKDLAAFVGQTVTLDGMVHALRPLGGRDLPHPASARRGGAVRG